MVDLSYPYWYLVFCAGLSLLATWTLYFFKKTTLSKQYQYLLTITRFVALFLISVLLLKPVVKYASIIFEKPIIIVGIDNSESILLSKDSTLYKNTIEQKIKELQLELGEDFKWQQFTFGESNRLNKSINYSDKTSDLSAFIAHINDYYSYDNVNSVILISDGIINKGANPQFQKWDVAAPIYTVGVGDSSLQIDQRITGLRVNSISHIGNTIPVKVDVNIDGMKGKKAVVKLNAFNQKPFMDTIVVGSNEFSQELSFLIEASEVGKHKIAVSVVPIEGELNTTNNLKWDFVNVKDRTQNVLMVYEYPSPDVKAIRLALEEQDGIELKLVSTEEFLAISAQKLKEKYSTVVSFQIPIMTQESGEAFTQLNNSGLPIWFIGSERTNYLKWFSSDASISWQGKMNSTNEVEPAFNKDFGMFTVSENIEVSKNWAPVKVPFGTITNSVAAKTLAYQSVGGIRTEDKLWIFTMPLDKGRRSYFFGDGIWRWRMSEYQQNENSDFFNDITKKTVQVLNKKIDLAPLKVKLKDFYYEGELIDIRAQLFNLNYELINKPEVKFKLVNAENEETVFELDKTNNVYVYSLGKIAEGEYSYSATTTYEGKQYKASGNFLVKPIQLEYENTRANFTLLSNLALKSNGKFFKYDNWSDLKQELKLEKPVTKSFEETKVQDLIHQKWLFGLILFLIGLEWLLRKREGVI